MSYKSGIKIISVAVLLLFCGNASAIDAPELLKLLYDSNPAKFKDITFSDDTHQEFTAGEDQSTTYSVYCADLNNDGIEEVIVISHAGSGGYLNIEGMYVLHKHGYVNRVDEIDIQLRKLMRDYQHETWDLEDGFAGYIHGSFSIHNKKPITFTIVERLERPDVFTVEAHAYTFCWEEHTVSLIDAHVTTNS